MWVVCASHSSARNKLFGHTMHHKSFQPFIMVTLTSVFLSIVLSGTGILPTVLCRPNHNSTDPSNTNAPASATHEMIYFPISFTPHTRDLPQRASRNPCLRYRPRPLMRAGPCSHADLQVTAPVTIPLQACERTGRRRYRDRCLERPVRPRAYLGRHDGGHF